MLNPDRHTDCRGKDNSYDGSSSVSINFKLRHTARGKIKMDTSCNRVFVSTSAHVCVGVRMGACRHLS